ncbi:hypothetical protein [Mycoplasma buteonis]|uniref:hypothetical protein n=1 Tax=Mycoplasma buteonis TaxID=171280 RepID=UPI0012EB5775|nr:hypothetical protein [Mycoplasma buteonis]
MKKIIKAFIVSFYIITILLSSGFLGLAIYILGTSDDILILGVFQLFTAIFIIVYVHIMIIPVIIYQTIKWNSLEEEDFKNKILWVLFNRYAKEYPYWWMKKNINIHIKNKKGYDEEIFWK